MNFTYYTSLAIGLAVDLVNTLHAVTGDDTLVSEADLRQFLVAHTEAVALSAQEAIADSQEQVTISDLYRAALDAWAISDDDVAALRALRIPLRSVFGRAVSEQREVAQLLNEQLRQSGATPRISWQHGPLHLHFESAEAGCARWLAATTTMGLVMLVCDFGIDRLGICADPTCRAAFIDMSKNARKRYCSEACAHRASVAAFRARRRERRGDESPH